MHYSIERPSDAGGLAILEATLDSFRTDREMQSDLARLSKACCQPRTFVTLQGAPVPTRVASESA
jgi:ArsR family transcriptional regulator